MSHPAFPVADVELARRLERAEATSSAAYVDAHAKTTPALGARWIDVDGACAMFDGPQSPLTQTFGLALFQPARAATLDELERFFRERDAPVHHEVTPLADPAILGLFADRGYHPVEFTTILYRPIHADMHVAGAPGHVRVRAIREGEHERWAEVAARGWDAAPELAAFFHDLARVNAHNARSVEFVAEIDGEAAATGALYLAGDVALLAGASTIPERRRQGAQLALLEHRLRDAAARGCTLAMMGARPGSQSQRNAERQGFRVAYTRVKWSL